MTGPTQSNKAKPVWSKADSFLVSPWPQMQALTSLPPLLSGNSSKQEARDCQGRACWTRSSLGEYSMSRA